MHLLEWLELKIVITSSAGKDEEKLNHANLAGRSVKWYSYIGKQFGSFFFFFLILFIFERERSWVGVAQREGDRGSEAGSTRTTEPNAGLEPMNHEITT